MLRIFLSVVFFIATASSVFAAEGVAMIKGTAEGSPITGEVKFVETDEGLSIEAKVTNVTPAGKRGFHIHEFGSCADTGKAAGNHYNPDGAPHGHLAHDGFADAHAGDLGNIEIKEDGTGELKTFLPELSLSEGEYNIGGRAVVLHEKEDDFGQPLGNAGGRVGCGAIIITK